MSVEKVNVTFINGTTITVEGDEGLFKRISEYESATGKFEEDGLVLVVGQIIALRRLK